MSESLRDRLIRVAKAAPFRYTDIVDAVMRELADPKPPTDNELFGVCAHAEARCEPGHAPEAENRAVYALGYALGFAHGLAAAEATHTELLAALEFSVQGENELSMGADSGVLYWRNRSTVPLGRELTFDIEYDGTGASIAAALIRAHKEST